MDLSGNSTTRLRPQQQYEINRDLDLSAVTDEKGHINGQWSLPADMRFGRESASANACGAIAVCNYLRDTERDVSLPEVIRTADEWNCFTLDGTLGILPGGVKRLLKAYGVSYREIPKHILQSYADNGHMFDRERFIAMIWNDWPTDAHITKFHVSEGAHSFLLVYDEEGKKIEGKNENGHWIAYNRHVNDNKECVYANLDDVLEGESHYWKILELEGDRGWGVKSEK